MTGEFGPWFGQDKTTPEVVYLGDHRVLEVPLGQFNQSYAVTMPGDTLFIELLDQLVIIFHGVATGVGAQAQLDSLDTSLDYLKPFSQQARLLYRRATETPVTATSGVDSDGCTLDQFCAGFAVARKRSALRCTRSDLRNDEPLRLRPHDCRVARAAPGVERCVADEG